MQSTVEWWRGAVIYQIYLRSFADSDGDGVGDLRGLESKLDYVASLGVDAIWISPFFTSPMLDFGYDVADYNAVDPLFGTMEDFDRVVARAHALGLKVILDQVWSHTSDQHPWFQASRRRRGSGEADWYVWADARPDGSPPNNWLSVFGGSGWAWEPRRRQYYLHHFLASQPKLNLRHPQVVEALFESANFWLRRGVDGFRFDAVDFMLNDPALRDNPPAIQPDGQVPLRPFRMQHHHYDMMHPETTPWVSRIRSFMDGYKDRLTIGEISSEPGSFNRIEALTGGGGQRLNMAYTLGVMKGEFSASAMKRTLENALEAERQGWFCWSFSNHDVARVASRWNPEPGGDHDDAFAKLSLALLFFLRGSVCLYQGEELGLSDVDIELADMRDPYGITYYPEFRGRDGSRTPMPWRHDMPNGCFTTAARPWLPIPDAHKARAVDVQESNATSCLAAVRALLVWRRTNEALRSGALTMPTVDDPVLAVCRRSADGTAATGVFNLGAESIRIATPSPELREIEITGFDARRCDGGIELPPFGAYFAGTN
ncbi:MAG: alpha-glucosidase [Parvibaculum sp.]|uniref:alpha-amylase family glycosyl hydrolase n=1 Tax=Parvibaculum sp. TaxID=2024848 RepID=UPI0025FBBA50|nr:alpha-amylase family glycosyl hydrolase [Parvibaculum sp.]MCE9650318.1 alpha-glucosidase [Parvibaculum sp.]